MAIESLSATNGDLISRADAMAEFREWVKRANENGETLTWNDAVSLIGSLPSADDVQGEWEDREVFNETDDDHIVEEWQSARCSVCGKYHTTPYMYYFDDFNFCPNCGARMKGGTD